LYLGLVHRIPVLMTWDEQIAEDEHRVLRQAARAVDWSQPFAAPGVCLRVDDRCATGPGRLNLTRWEAAFARLPLMCGLLEPDSPAPPGAPLVLDGSAPAPDLLLRSAGGPLPDELAERAPLRLAPGYAASYAWSADARTLLAYVYNVADHEDVPASYDLSGRYHRLPQPTALRLALCGFPGGALRARLYDLNRQALHREMRFARDASLDLGKTDRDYLLLVTP
jgi:hypothetical protein